MVMFHQSDGYSGYGGEYYSGTGHETDESHGSRARAVHVSQAFMDGLYPDDEIRAVRFDPHEELLWSISANGHLTGYFEYGLTRVVSVEVPELGGSERGGKGRQGRSGTGAGKTSGSSEGVGELRAVLLGAQACDRIVMVLAERALLVYSKTGVRRALISPSISVTNSSGSNSTGERLENMRCLCLATSAATGASSNPSNVIIGTDSRLALFDIDTGQVTRHISLSPHSTNSTSVADAALDHSVGAVQLLAHSRGLLCATDDGQIVSVDWRDRRSIQQHHSFRPHSHSLSDFTANSEGYAVVSCGTFLCNQRVYTDPYLKVYDLRYRKAQCPIKVVQEMQPGFVRFVPGFNDSILLADPCGRFQIANFGENELPAPLDEALLVSEYDSVRTIDISSSSRLIAFGTRGGLISLVANTSTGPGVSNSAGNSAVGTGAGASSTGVSAGVTAAVGACEAVGGSGPTDLASNSSLKINHCSNETVFPPVPTYMQLPPVPFNDTQFITCSAEFAVHPLDTTRFSSLSSDWPAHLCSGRYRKLKPVDMSLFSQYQSKFKTELIGRKPASWGPVWFPY